MIVMRSNLNDFRTGSGTLVMPFRSVTSVRLRGVLRLRGVSRCSWFSMVPIAADSLYVSRWPD